MIKATSCRQESREPQDGSLLAKIYQCGGLSGRFVVVHIQDWPPEDKHVGRWPRNNPAYGHRYEEIRRPAEESSAGGCSWGASNIRRSRSCIAPYRHSECKKYARPVLCPRNVTGTSCIAALSHELRLRRQVLRNRCVDAPAPWPGSATRR